MCRAIRRQNNQKNWNARGALRKNNDLQKTTFAKRNAFRERIRLPKRPSARLKTNGLSRRYRGDPNANPNQNFQENKKSPLAITKKEGIFLPVACESGSESGLQTASNAKKKILKKRLTKLKDLINLTESQLNDGKRKPSESKVCEVRTQVRRYFTIR